MAKDKGWPWWKTVVVMVGLPIGAVAMWVMAHFAQVVVDTKAEDAGTSGPFGLSTILQMIGLIMVGVFGIMVVWHIHRYYKSIPAWKRHKGLPPRR